jgi:hypothetical protein
MITKEVFEPARRQNVNGPIIGSHLFITEKRNENGEFIKYKARLVALGNGQIMDDNVNVSSPTVSGESIMLCLGLAAQRRWQIATADVTGAYLEAPMGEEDVVFMELNRELTKRLCGLSTEYTNYVDEKGKLVVKLQKALYGCKSSSLTLNEFLVNSGFRRCNYDGCVYVKIGIILCIHVDDFLILADSTSEILKFQEVMKTRFSGVTMNFGRSLSFLGMRIRMDQEGIKLDMQNYLDAVNNFEDLLDCNTPASVELLSDDDSNQLCEKDKVLFHALVAKLLYLVKRSRPDGLLVISKLSTRVGCPYISDMKILKKMCEYFKSTADFGTVLKWELQGDVNFFVDASYACDTDCRSRTGVVMSIGGVALSCWTNKQSLVARSSTEAEII